MRLFRSLCLFDAMQSNHLASMLSKLRVIQNDQNQTAQLIRCFQPLQHVFTCVRGCVYVCVLTQVRASHCHMFHRLVSQIERWLVSIDQLSVHDSFTLSILHQGPHLQKCTVL